MNNVTIRIQIYKGNTEILDIRKGSAYRLISISGVEFPTIDYYTAEKVSNGAYFINKRYESRAITLIFGIQNLSRSEEYRTNLINNLEQGTDIRLVITRNGISREISGVIENPILTQINLVRDRARITMNILSLESFFKGLTDKVYTFVSGTVETANYGHFPANFTATLTATGACSNPKLSLDNNTYIEIKRSLASGDVLEISSGGDNSIKLNGESIFDYNIDSTFFDIPVGNSTISLTGENIGGTVSFREQFRGI